MTIAGNTEDKNRLPVGQKFMVGREFYGGVSLLWWVHMDSRGLPVGVPKQDMPIFAFAPTGVTVSYITHGNIPREKQLLATERH